MSSSPKEHADCLKKLEEFFAKIESLSLTDIEKTEKSKSLLDKFGQFDADNDTLATLNLVISTKPKHTPYLPGNVIPVITSLEKLFAAIDTHLQNGKYKYINADDLNSFITDDLIGNLDKNLLTPELYFKLCSLVCALPDGSIDTLHLNTIMTGINVTIEKENSICWQNKIKNLQQECERYQAHLKREVEILMRNSNLIKLSSIQADQLDNDPIIIPEENLDDFSSVDQLTINKYNIVNDLLAHLNNSKSSPCNKIANFYLTFSEQKPILEKRRDTPFITFLKGVCSAISFGIAVPFLWRVQGKNFASNVNSIFAGKILEQKPSSVEIRSLRAAKRRGNLKI